MDRGIFSILRRLPGPLSSCRGLYPMFFAVLASVCLCSMPVLAAEPLGLMDAYTRALEYDAQFGAAQADRAISREEVAKAKAAFLPNLRSTVSKGRNYTESTTGSGGYNEQYYSTLSSSLSLKQPIFNLGSIAAYKQAKAIYDKSESLLLNEGSSLIIRTAEAFFGVLFADDNLEYSKAQSAASLEQLSQARKKYLGGYGTVTDVSEAQAGYDLALAEEASAVASAEFSRRELERVTGVYADRLSRLSAEKMALAFPEPANVDAWLALASTNSHKVNAARLEIAIAGKEVDKNRVARYPVVEFWAGKNYSQSETNYTIGSIYDTWSISIQASVPIYTGGYNSALVRQSKARQLKALDEFAFQERSTMSDIRKYYNAQVNGIAQVKAYGQAVRAHEIAFEGTKKGFLAGFRTNADVLDAQKRLFDSRRNLSKSRYQYLLNSLMLKDAAGVLSSADLDRISCSLVP